MLAADLLAQPRVQQLRHVRRAGDQFRQPLAEFTGQPLRAVAFDEDLLQHRLGHRPDVQLRIQQPAHAFDVEQRLLQQDQLRLQGEFVFLRGAEDLDQHFGQRDFRQRPGEVRLADRARGRFQFVDADMRRNPAGLHVKLGDAAIVAIEDRHEILGEVVLVLARQLADDAEIDRDEARVVLARRVAVDPDVAGVRIGVEEVVAEHLGVEHAHAFRGQRAAIDAGGVQRGDVVAGNAVHAFEREHALGGMAPDHVRHIQIRRILAVLAHPEPADHRRVGALALQVELGRERGFHFAHDFARADLVGVGMRALHQCGDAAQQRNVAVDLFLDVGTQHFHHHFAPARQARGVHLRDRRRRQRRGVEMLEGFADVLAERGFDDPARGFAVEGRHPVLQQRQLGRDVRRHQVAAGRQDLPELDEDRPQLLQREAQAHAAGLQGDLARRARHERARELQPALGGGVVEQVVQSITDQDPADPRRAQHRVHDAAPMDAIRLFRRATRAARRSASSRSVSTSS